MAGILSPSGHCIGSLPHHLRIFILPCSIKTARVVYPSKHKLAIIIHILSDSELVQRCLKGDAQAQKQFYDRFAKRMLGVCYRYVQNTPEAEDLLQEGYIRAFRYMKDFRGEGSLEGWLRRIMVTTSINFLKSQKNFRAEIELDAAHEQPGEVNQILQRMENQEVLKLIQQLSPGYRAVLNLFAVEGYSHREIGDLLGIGESTSRSQYTRAKQLLQKKIEDHFSFGIHHGRSEQGK